MEVRVRLPAGDIVETVRCLGLLVIALAACGRIGFSERTAASDADPTTDSAGGGTSLRLGQGGSQSYVQLGDPAELHLTVFTIEMWLFRVGAGDISGSGNPPAALDTVVPLLTKGRGEAENPDVDINFFVGLMPDANFVLGADFEEAQNGPDPSQNHGVTGTVPITPDVWHHIAVRYDGQVWKLFVDGVQDLEVDLGQPTPIASASMVDAVIGGASNSSGDVNGFFEGFIDEVRIWRVVRSMAEVAAFHTHAIMSHPDLAARWSFDEGSGATVTDSSSGLVGQVEPPALAAYGPGAPID